MATDWLAAARREEQLERESAQQATIFKGTPSPTRIFHSSPAKENEWNEIWVETLDRPLRRREGSSLLKRLPWLSGSPLRHQLGPGGKEEAAQKEAAYNLRLAAISGDDGSLREALHDGALVDDPDPLEGNTALFEAARKGHKQLVELLLEAGADSEKRNSLEQTPMQEAVRQGRAEAVRVLIAYGAHTQHPPEGADTGRDWHGLVDVARRGYVDTADALCSDPTLNLDWANNLGETPLLTAARLGHGEVVAVLASHGANVNQRADNGSTPLMVAAEEGQTSVVRYLLHAKARVNDVDEKGSTALLYASRVGRHEIYALCAIAAKEHHAGVVFTEWGADTGP